MSGKKLNTDENERKVMVDTFIGGHIHLLLIMCPLATVIIYVLVTMCEE
jgi:hypothetical protein